MEFENPRRRVKDLLANYSSELPHIIPQPERFKHVRFESEDAKQNLARSRVCLEIWGAQVPIFRIVLACPSRSTAVHFELSVVTHLFPFPFD
jgi:hypothetical protein